MASGGLVSKIGPTRGHFVLFVGNVDAQRRLWANQERKPPPSNLNRCRTTSELTFKLSTRRKSHRKIDIFLELNITESQWGGGEGICRKRAKERDSLHVVTSRTPSKKADALRGATDAWLRTILHPFASLRQVRLQRQWGNAHYVKIVVMEAGGSGKHDEQSGATAVFSAMVLTCLF